MPVAIVLAIVFGVFGVIAIVSFFQGKITFGDFVNGVQQLNPIPKPIEFTLPLLIVSAGGLLIGIAAIFASRRGNPLPATPPSPSLPSFSVSTPGLGVSIGSGTPAMAAPSSGGRRRGP